MRAKTWADDLSGIEVPRRTGFAHWHDPVEMLVTTICAVFAEVEGFEDVARWPQVKEAWMRHFLMLKNGILSADTFSRALYLLEPKAFESAFREWVGSALPAFNQVAIDGKCLRGAGDGKRGPVHMVTAYATDIGFALAQDAVADKSNEIVCDERARRQFGDCGVSPEMRVGRSKSACRSRFQTATSCVGKEPSW